MVLAALTTRTAGASETLNVPLSFDHAFLREALASQLYTTATGKAVLWDDGSGCGFLKLREPAVSTAGTRLRIVSRGEARVGTPIGEQCLAPLQWDGLVEVFEEPVISDDQSTLRFRVVESNVYDSNGKKRFFSGKVWDLVKRHVQPSFEAVQVDLQIAAGDLRGFLPLVLGRDDTQRVTRIVDSLRLTTATVTDSGVTVIASLSAEPSTAVAPIPEPTLTPEELQRWQIAWQHWDAFLTFVLKRLWGDTLIAELRQPLAEVLLEARFDILEALVPPAPGAPDPVPGLFLKTWERLAPIVRQSVARQPGSTALRYLSFITAGDALVALQQAGPAIGLDISADGLRRLARIIAPTVADDPLIYDTAVDPQLRQLLGFGPPLPPPDLSDAPPDDVWWRQLFETRRAYAVGEAPSADSLRRWLALPESLDTYLPSVREVLELATKITLDSADLDHRYHDVYRRLVLATAWQESCWRQFVVAGGQITYLKSGVGAAGMMQVNEKVWRGVYDSKGLRWDIRYNGRAGAEIILHYLNDYAIAKKEDRLAGGLDNLAKATYATYNGGPGQMARYRKSTTKRGLKRIDKLFWEKFDAVSKGRAMDVAKCFAGA
jgi:soluble lytic murein transglycosylase-like protein